MAQEQAPQGMHDNIIQINKKFFKATCFWLAGYWFWPATGAYSLYPEIGLKLIAAFLFYRCGELSISAFRNIYAYERSEAQTEAVKSKGREQSSDGLATTQDLEKAGLLS